VTGCRQDDGELKEHRSLLVLGRIASRGSSFIEFQIDPCRLGDYARATCPPGPGPARWEAPV